MASNFDNFETVLTVKDEASSKMNNARKSVSSFVSTVKEGIGTTISRTFGEMRRTVTDFAAHVQTKTEAAGRQFTTLSVVVEGMKLSTALLGDAARMAFSQFVPGGDLAVKALGIVAKSLASMMPLVTSVGGGLLKAATSGAKAVSAVGGFAMRQGKGLLDSVLGPLLESITRITQPIMRTLAMFLDDALAPVAQGLQSLVTSFVPILQRVVGPLAEFMGTVFMHVAELVTSAVEGGGPLGQLFAEMQKTLPVILRTAKSLLPILGGVFNLFVGITQRLVQLGAAIVRVVREHVLPWLGKVSGWFSGLDIQGALKVVAYAAGYLAGLAERLWGWISGVFTSGWEFIKGWWDMLAGLFTGNFDLLTDGLAKMIDSGKELVSLGIDAILVAIGALWEGIKLGAKLAWAAVETGWNALVGVFSTAGEAVGRSLGAMWELISGAFLTVVDKTTGAIESAFTATWNAVGNTFKSVINVVITGINTVLELINSVIRAVKVDLTIPLPDFLGGDVGLKFDLAESMGTIPTIPKLLRTGAMIAGGTSGTPVIVGDGGNPEIVAPLTPTTQRLVNDMIVRGTVGGVAVDPKVREALQSQEKRLKAIEYLLRDILDTARAAVSFGIGGASRTSFGMGGFA